jgi:hypothetical protein
VLQAHVLTHNKVTQEIDLLSRTVRVLPFASKLGSRISLATETGGDDAEEQQLLRAGVENWLQEESCEATAQVGKWVLEAVTRGEEQRLR